MYKVGNVKVINFRYGFGKYFYLKCLQKFDDIPFLDKFKDNQDYIIYSNKG